MAQSDLHPRRHVFHGHASGVTARIRRPVDRRFPVQGSSSLPVTGGLHQSKVDAGNLEKWVSFKSVSTSADGDYVDAAQGRATTLGELAFDAAPTVTKVKAAVEDLEILGRVKVAHAAMGLTSHSAVGREQPKTTRKAMSWKASPSTVIVSRSTLAEDLFRECNTKDKLAKRHAGLSPRQKRMFLPAVSGADEATGFPEANGTVKCSIVQDIRWDGPANPKATIHDHVVEVKDFGKMYFGEMFIKGDSRRLTMVRCQLGAPMAVKSPPRKGKPTAGAGLPSS